MLGGRERAACLPEGRGQSRALRAGRPPPARGQLGCQGPRARQLPPLARPRHRRPDALLAKSALTRLQLRQGPYRCPLGVTASWHSRGWPGSVGQDLPKPYGAEGRVDRAPPAPGGLPGAVSRRFEHLRMETPPPPCTTCAGTRALRGERRFLTPQARGAPPQKAGEERPRRARRRARRW